MENKSHIIAALIFIAVFGVGAVVFFLWLRPDNSADRTFISETSHSVGGLSTDSAVKFKGLKVGHITSVDFAPDDPNKVRIVFVVRDHVPVTQSSYAELSTQGITGLKTLELSNPNPNAKPLDGHHNPPARVPLHQALLAQLEASGKQDAKKINDILDHINQLLDDHNRRHLTQTLSHIDQLTRRLAAAEKSVEPALKQLPALVDQMQSTLAQVNRLAATAQKPVGQATAMEKSVQSLSESSGALVRRLNDDTLPRLDQIGQQLDRTMDHIDALTSELQAKPQSILTGPPAPRPGPGEPGFKPQP